MSAQELAEIEASLNTATPQEWEAVRKANYEWQVIHREADHYEVICQCSDGTADQNEANAAFIAQARQAVPALMAEIKRLRSMAGIAR